MGFGGLSNSPGWTFPEPRCCCWTSRAAGLTDEELARFVLAVRRWRDEGRCVVLVEHNHELINAVCDRTMVLAAGKVLGVGDLEELRRGEHIREIIGDRLD